jgi:hypothetical protein
MYQSVFEGGGKMITARDQSVINFLEEDGFHIATSNQLHKLFFPTTSYQYSRERLRYLLNNQCIKRTRSTIDNSYAYYVGNKPVQLHHDLIRTELYTAIKQRYDVLEWHNEAPIGNIRPDALCYIKHNGIVFPVLIEIHLSNGFNFDKYKMDFAPLLGTQPRVIICTDRSVKLPVSAVKFKLVGLDMSGLDALFK